MTVRRQTGRVVVCIAFAVAAVALGSAEPGLAKPSPCAKVRNVELPSDELGLTIIQRQILACVRHLQVHVFGKDNKQQCVPFANALMDVLRPAQRNRVVGQSRPHTAGHFTEALRARGLLFARDDKTGLPVDPSDLRSRPAFIWWNEVGKPNGHVGVYIGGGLFVDSYVGFELGRLSAREVNAIVDPAKWSWSVTPGPQTDVPWPEGHWPRQRVNDGYSVTRVRGA